MFLVWILAVDIIITVLQIVTIYILLHCHSQRSLDEQEAKLRSITANIKQSQDKSQPIRKAKMAYFDSTVKPPRNVARKQVSTVDFINGY